MRAQHLVAEQVAQWGVGRGRPVERLLDVALGGNVERDRAGGEDALGQACQLALGALALGGVRRKWTIGITSWYSVVSVTLMVRQQ